MTNSDPNESIDIHLYKKKTGKIARKSIATNLIRTTFGMIMTSDKPLMFFKPTGGLK
jgi:hypothetical protein